MISEPWRLPVLGLLAAIFAFVVVLVGGTLGIRSLIALGFTLGVVIKLVVPLLLRGVDPILLAVVGGAGVTTVTLLLTEGASRVTTASIAGVSVALLLTAALAAAFTGLAEFTALQGSEEIAFLIPLVGDRIDLGGILLAATVFGALGGARRCHRHSGGHGRAAPPFPPGFGHGRHCRSRHAGRPLAHRRHGQYACSWPTWGWGSRCCCYSPSVAKSRWWCSTARSSRWR